MCCKEGLKYAIFGARVPTLRDASSSFLSVGSSQVASNFIASDRRTPTALEMVFIRVPANISLSISIQNRTMKGDTCCNMGSCFAVLMTQIRIIWNVSS